MQFSWLELGFFGISCSIFGALLIRNKRRKALHHENPKVQGVNRIKSRTILCGFASESEARHFVLQNRCSPFVKSLNGVWKFTLFDCFQDAVKEMRSDSNKSMEGTIKVPSHWQLKANGDLPSYNNFKNSIPVTPPLVPDSNPTGYYKYQFELSKEWFRRFITITFSGVDSAYYVWINHQYVGFSKDSKLSTEFDISDFVKFDNKNLIEVLVVKYSDGFFLEDQEKWNLSGIFKDVWLTSFPSEVHISDFNWEIFDPGMMESTLNVNVELQWDPKNINKYSLEAHENGRSSYSASQYSSDWIITSSLYYEGVMVTSTTSTADSVQYFTFDGSSAEAISHVEEYIHPPTPSSIESDSSYKVNRSYEEQNKRYFTTKISHEHNVVSPFLWTAENPQVYTLVIAIKNTSDGMVIHTESCHVGFRSIDVTSGTLRVNNKLVLIRGVNMCEYDPYNGYNMSRRLMEADIKIMKRNNFNALRTPHAPSDPWLYELCTLYGLYVVDEANIETRGMKPYAGRLADDLRWEGAYMSRVCRMYERDKNHTSIVMWSLGNQSGYGLLHDKMAQWIRKRDCSRVVMYEPASYGPRSDADSGANISQNRVMATDILCPLNPKISDCIVLANRYSDLPLILCAYTHMQGGSGESMEDYWKAFHTYSRLQGGFVRDWLDEGLATVDYQGVPYWSVGGDYGQSSWKERFSLNGLNWPDRGLAHLAANTVGMWSSNNDSNSITKTDNPAASTSQAITHVYGLSPLEWEEVSTTMDTGLLRAISDDTIRINQAMAKPQLIEMKQCMKYFSCSIVRVDYSETVSNHSASDNGDAQPSRDVTPIKKGTTTASPIGDKINMSVKLVIKNLFDHIKDIQDVYSFDAILLCDGLIVQSVRIKDMTSCLVYSYVGKDEDQTQSAQEIDSRCSFSVNLTWKQGLRGVRGIAWQESLLLSPSTSDDINTATQSDNCNTKPLWRYVNHDTAWSIVVIARLAIHTSWAPINYPMGFVQTQCTLHKKSFKKSKTLKEKESMNNKSNKQKPISPERRISLTDENNSSTFRDRYIISIETLDVDTSRKIILLQADFNENGNTDISRSTETNFVEVPRRIQVGIDSSNGYITSFQVNGTNILAGSEINEHGIIPSRFLLHRPISDRDKKGYWKSWNALGLTCDMKHLPLDTNENTIAQGISTANNISPPLSYLHNDDGVVLDSKCVQVRKITSEIGDTFPAQGIECTWKMCPRKIDRGRLMLLLQVKSFLNDGNSRVKVIVVHSNGQERFIHELAATFMLAHKTLNSKESRAASKSATSSDTYLLDYANVRIWKPGFFPQSTIPLAEEMRDGPHGGLRLDETDTGDVDILNSNYVGLHEAEAKLDSKLHISSNKKSNEKVEKEKESDNSPTVNVNVRDILTITWKVMYLIDSNATLHVIANMSAPYVPCVLPRIGFNVNIASSFQTISWNGCGPHESYPERKSSAVKAVHEAMIDELHVPYILPCENGGRCETSWIQLDQDNHQKKTEEESKNGIESSVDGTPVKQPLSPSRHYQNISLTIRNNKLFLFNIQRYTPEDLMEAAHIVELERCKRPFSSLNIDSHIMGAEGGEKWDHDDFFNPPTNYSFHLSMSAIVRNNISHGGSDSYS